MEIIREQREKEINEMFKKRNEESNKVNDIFDEFENRKINEINFLKEFDKQFNIRWGIKED